MNEQFSRTELLLGDAAMDKLAAARVAIFGVGGVGGYVCEALARSGVGALDLIDNDTVSISNLNRQIIALHSTVGKYKTEVMEDRIRDINPEVRVVRYDCFFLPENADEFPWEEYDYVVDAVDTVTAKVALVMKCHEKNIPIISSMGAGNKLDPSAFKVADIYETSVCPLARVMRHEMKKRGVESLKVVYSQEKPITAGNTGKMDDRHTVDITRDKQLTESSNLKADEHHIVNITQNRQFAETVESAEKLREQSPPGKSAIPGSVAFVPSAAGLIIAGEVVKDLIGWTEKR